MNWDLTDNQGTVRDVAEYSVSTQTTSVVNHLVYDPFGHITSQTNAAYRPTFMYDGMWQDPTTGLDYDHARWYDAVDGVFASQDPLGFAGGQTNTSEYCGNSPTNGTDPTGEFGWGLATTIGGCVIGGATNGLIYAFAAQDNATPGGFWGAVAGGAVAGAMVARPCRPRQPPSPRPITASWSAPPGLLLATRSQSSSRA